MLLGSCWVYPQALPLIHISVLRAACHSASEQEKLSAKGPVWGQAHCECPANHAGLAELRHGWTVRSAPSTQTGGKHWRKNGSLCLPGGKGMKCLIFSLWRSTPYLYKTRGQNIHSHRKNTIVYPPLTFFFVLQIQNFLQSKNKILWPLYWKKIQ